MVAEKRILPAARVAANVNVADLEIKERRSHRRVRPDPAYPRAMVSDHVPFYIAAKSPMLYRVCRGHDGYQGGRRPLVMLGIALGDIIDTGLTWCASDRNAATPYARFSRELSSLGEFVDFPLLSQRDWFNTPDDGDRKSRRSAEVLVHQEVPLDLITQVRCFREDTLRVVRAHLEDVGGIREYGVDPKMYY